MSTFNILNSVLRNANIKESLTINNNRSLGNQSFLKRHMQNDKPIEPKEASWQTVDNMGIDVLSKTYTFSEDDHLVYFVNEVLQASFRINHHPLIKIDHNEIYIELYTKDINVITGIDIKLSKIIDEIFQDIDYIVQI